MREGEEAEIGTLMGNERQMIGRKAVVTSVRVTSWRAMKLGQGVALARGLKLCMPLRHDIQSQLF